jgi:hypothetical protein
MGVKIIVGTIHELSLQGFTGYAHLITTRCLLVIEKKNSPLHPVSERLPLREVEGSRTATPLRPKI